LEKALASAGAFWFAYQSFPPSSPEGRVSLFLIRVVSSTTGFFG